MVRDFGIHQKHKERKKFLKYSLFAWLIPIICVTTTIVFERYEILSRKFTPLIGHGQCIIQKCKFHQQPIIYPRKKDIIFPFVAATYGYHIFYVFPIALLTLINIVLFIKTTYYCIKVKQEINKRRDVGKKKCFLMDKER